MSRNCRPGTIRQEVCQQGSRPDTVFSRDEMTVKIACLVKETIHVIHAAIKHVTGTVSGWIFVGFDKRGGLRT